MHLEPVFDRSNSPRQIGVKLKGWDGLAQRLSIRDESCRISGQDKSGERYSTMFRYVIGEPRAVAAVNAWA